MNEITHVWIDELKDLSEDAIKNAFKSLNQETHTEYCKACNKAGCTDYECMDPLNPITGKLA